MALRYGTDASESDAFVRRRIAAPDRRPAASTARKHVVAAVGATVLAGSALLGYQASRSTTAMLRAEPTTALAFDPTTYDVPTFLRHDAPIVVFAGDANSICLDDGSARKSALSTVTARACHATSVDQVFVYDDQHLMLQSAKKPDLCLSDGGAAQPGDGPVHMALCDVESPDQRFIYDEATVAFRNPTKNLCLSNGGGVGAENAPFTMEACDPQAPAQVFRIMWQREAGGQIDDFMDEAPAEPAPVPVEQPTYGASALRTEGESPLVTPDANAMNQDVAAEKAEDGMMGGRVPSPMYEPSEPERGEPPAYAQAPKEKYADVSNAMGQNTEPQRHDTMNNTMYDMKSNESEPAADSSGSGMSASEPETSAPEAQGSEPEASVPAAEDSEGAMPPTEGKSEGEANPMYENPVAPAEEAPQDETSPMEPIEQQPEPETSAPEEKESDYMTGGDDAADGGADADTDDDADTTGSDDDADDDAGDDANDADARR